MARINISRLIRTFAAILIGTLSALPQGQMPEPEAITPSDLMVSNELAVQLYSDVEYTVTHEESNLPGALSGKRVGIARVIISKDRIRIEETLFPHEQRTEQLEAVVVANDEYVAFWGNRGQHVKLYQRGDDGGLAEAGEMVSKILSRHDVRRYVSGMFGRTIAEYIHGFPAGTATDASRLADGTAVLTITPPGADAFKLRIFFDPAHAYVMTGRETLDASGQVVARTDFTYTDVEGLWFPSVVTTTAGDKTKIARFSIVNVEPQVADRAFTVEGLDMPEGQRGFRISPNGVSTIWYFTAGVIDEVPDRIAEAAEKSQPQESGCCCVIIAEAPPGS